MPTEIPDLWGDDIRVDTLPPAVVLRAQGEAISRKTQGMVKAEVVTGEVQVDPAVPAWIEHTLELFAPVVGYQEPVLIIRHDAKKLYPVTLQVPDPIRWKAGHEDASYTAYTADEFIEALRAALQSRPTRALITSLIAQSNETKLPPGRTG